MAWIPVRLKLVMVYLDIGYVKDSWRRVHGKYAEGAWRPMEDSCTLHMKYKIFRRITKRFRKQPCIDE